MADCFFWVKELASDKGVAGFLVGIRVRYYKVSNKGLDIGLPIRKFRLDLRKRYEAYYYRGTNKRPNFISNIGF